MTTIMEIKQEYENHHYLHHLGIEILSLEKEKVMIRLNVQDYLLNTNGTLHGGVCASLLDIIQSIQLRIVTKIRSSCINSTVFFMAPVQTGIVYAEASILSKAYKTAFVEGKLIDEKGRLISKGISTYRILI
ncbi:PaaI family thioesterase [Sporosarcina obsidiansis]|uniref:PaaI family thioesterase n=1 Tax=Sporosarcina obsidiansis TaxID=2660748 RepID=UPI00129A8BE2|nr:PaaI family thioesterase [Sporosarcina obsidiansis]